MEMEVYCTCAFVCKPSTNYGGGGLRAVVPSCHLKTDRLYVLTCKHNLTLHLLLHLTKIQQPIPSHGLCLPHTLLYNIICTPSKFKNLINLASKHFNHLLYGISMPYNF